MTKLAVCGASWFSTDPVFPDKSWPEIICKNNRWELISLARGGCSNFAICLQIDKAIELGADFIVVGTDTSDRIDIPINNEDQVSWIKKIFDFKSWTSEQPSYFKKSKGLSNVRYTKRDLSGRQHEWLKNPTIVSESLNNLAWIRNNPNYYTHDIGQNQLDTIKEYMIHLYDAELKKQQDCWIVSDACSRLTRSQKPFLIFVDPLFSNDFAQDIAWLDRIHKVDSAQFNYRNLSPDKPISQARFHYCEENSGEIIANYVNERLKKL